MYRPFSENKIAVLVFKSDSVLVMAIIMVGVPGMGGSGVEVVLIRTVWFPFGAATSRATTS